MQGKHHVFGRKTVAAQWVVYSSHASGEEAAKAARELTRAERVNEAIVVEVVHDFTALGCSKSFG